MPRSYRHLLSALGVGVLLLAAAAQARASQHSAYAPPGAFGPWTTVASHVGSVGYTITAKPTGNVPTRLVGEVSYYDEAGNPVTRQFSGSVSFRTGRAYANVQVRFKAIPTGTFVDVTVSP